MWLLRNWWLYVYPLICLLYINFGQELFISTLKDVGSQLTLSSDGQPFTLIIIAILFIIALFKITKKIKLSSTSILTPVILFISINYFSCFNQYYIRKIFRQISIIFWNALPPLIVLHQISNYQHLKQMYILFTNKQYNPQTYKDYWSKLKWILLILYMFITNGYCIFIHGFECRTFNSLNASFSCLIIGLAFPYYFVPEELKTDIHLKKHKMWLLKTSINMRFLVDALWVYQLKHVGIDKKWYLMARSLMDILLVSTFDAIPSLLQWTKKQRFKRLCNIQNIAATWSEYIGNKHNCQQFMRYLLSLNIFQNVLFIQEVMRYKTEIKSKFNLDYCGFEVEFAEFDQIYAKQTPLIRELSELDITDISIEKLQQDMLIMYDKYINITKQSIITVNLVSLDHCNEIRELLCVQYSQKSVNNNMVMANGLEALIKIFDKSTKEINDFLQLIYEQYHLNQ